MKKILLAILTVISVFHIICHRGGFEAESSIIKVAAQDEDSKNEKEDIKRPYEELYYHTSVEYYLLNTSAGIGSLSDKIPHYALTEKPNTPPPDFI